MVLSLTGEKSMFNDKNQLECKWSFLELQKDGIAINLQLTRAKKEMSSCSCCNGLGTTTLHWHLLVEDKLLRFLCHTPLFLAGTSQCAFLLHIKYIVIIKKGPAPRSTELWGLLLLLPQLLLHSSMPVVTNYCHLEFPSGPGTEDFTNWLTGACPRWRKWCSFVVFCDFLSWAFSRTLRGQPCVQAFPGTEDTLLPGLLLLIRCESCREKSLATSHKDLSSSGALDNLWLCLDFSLWHNFLAVSHAQALHL